MYYLHMLIQITSLIEIGGNDTAPAGMSLLFDDSEAQAGEDQFQCEIN